MRICEVRLRDFRSYADVRVELGPGVTVIAGANGAGKTNLIEALYFGCTGRSPRTTNEREVVRFGTSTTRVVVEAEGDDGPHELSVAFSPSQPKVMKLDGARVERLADCEQRPLVSVFSPDRLELIKGAPGLRRAHLDQVICALWPGRAATRRTYAQALAQRNALISRVRAGEAASSSLTAWDVQLSRHGIALMRDRAQASEALAERFPAVASALALDGSPAVFYKPRSRAQTAEELAEELAGRLDSDLTRGFTGHGPHRDDLAIVREGRELRAFGSQGQQRVALLGLLLAERALISDVRGSTPVMLLDDVMSELDATRRSALLEILGVGGQAVVTTTDCSYLPDWSLRDASLLEVDSGSVLEPQVTP